MLSYKLRENKQEIAVWTKEFSGRSDIWWKWHKRVTWSRCSRWSCWWQPHLPSYSLQEPQTPGWCKHLCSPKRKTNKVHPCASWSTHPCANSICMSIQAVTLQHIWQQDTHKLISHQSNTHTQCATDFSFIGNLSGRITLTQTKKLCLHFLAPSRNMLMAQQAKLESPI